MENLVAGLKKNTIREIDKDPADKVVGWTSFEKPYQPDFESDSLSIGTYWIFSLRIDKKKNPAKSRSKDLCTGDRQKIEGKWARVFVPQ